MPHTPPASQTPAADLKLALEPAGFGTQIYGYRGDTPRWTAVAEEKLARAPYRRICAIRCEHTALGIGRGSGWLHESGLILTAAHVVDGFQKVFIRFANQTQWTAVPNTSIEIDQGYFRGGKPQQASQFDIARIRIDHSDEDVDEPFDLPSQATEFRAIGFQGDILVEHAGIGKSVGAFLTYEAETGANHSGCPIFHKGQALGLHVGYFTASSDYLDPADQNTLGYLNSAIIIA